jgi:hypothetical protein
LASKNYLVSSSSYVLGQASNLLLQGWLYKSFPETYGSIGLLYLMATMVVFLQDFGYQQFFLREIPKNEVGWIKDWQSALTLKLLLSLVLIGGLLLYNYTFVSDKETGFLFLVPASVGMIFAIFNPASIFFAQGSVLKGSLVIPFQAITGSITTLIFSLYFGLEIATACGVGFACGWASVFAFSLIAAKNKEIFKFGSLKGRKLSPSLPFYLTSVSGVLYDRAFLVLAEIADPRNLAFLIIIVNIVQGLLGALSQMQKVFLPELSALKRRGLAFSKTNSFQEILLVSCIGVLVLVVLLSLLEDIQFFTPAVETFFAPIVIDAWFSALGMIFVSFYLADGREVYLRNLVVVVQVFGAIFLLIAVLLSSALLELLYIKALVNFLLFFVVCRCYKSSSTIALTIFSLMYCVVSFSANFFSLPTIVLALPVLLLISIIRI